MKPFYLLIIFSIIAGCYSKTKFKSDLEPTYNNFENSWEEKNLYGKVKKLEQFKTIFQNSNQEGETALTFKELYTNFGAIKLTEYYNNSGELLQKDTYKYDKNGHPISFLSKNLPPNLNIAQLIKNDTTNNITKRVVFVNDSINQISIEYYNDKGYITKHIKIEDNDTIVALNSYKFNKRNQIERSVQKEKKTGDTLLVYHYKYNDKGNYIEFSTRSSKWGGFINKYKWKDDKILEEKQFTVYLDSTKHLNTITEYDDFYNPINIKKFMDFKLNSELKYKYKFDEKGNWIERLVLMKEHYVNSKEFTPAYIETRKIKYWN